MKYRVTDMRCTQCGHDNPEDAQFCAGCDTSLSAPTGSGIGVGTDELPRVSFIESIKLGFRNYFRFSGRSTRAEYWWWVLFVTFVGFALQLVDFLIFGELELFYLLFSLAVLIPSLALGVRRLHDIRKSGWWQLWIMLLPLVSFGSAVIFGRTVAIFTFYGLLIGMGWLIIWLVRKGDEGPNKYGPDPRQVTSQQPQ